MYVVKDYLTNETVAMCSRKEDAIAMMSRRPTKDEPRLIVEKM